MKERVKNIGQSTSALKIMSQERGSQLSGVTKKATSQPKGS